MNSYQIGRVEGRWKNFLPPIQGGTFRKYNGESDDLEVTSEAQQDESSSLDSSRSVSPVFEDSGVRRRKSLSTSPSSTGSSSPPSVSKRSQSETKPSFLDARTQEEIIFDIAKYPSLDSETQDSIVEKYHELRERIRAEGLYQCNYYAYLVEICRYTLLVVLSLFCLRHAWYGTSGLFLGLFWHQLVFSAHDAGHMGITHNFHVDSVIGIIISDYLGGLSMGWWKRNHNVHHIVTNSPEHDPDIEHLPFFAISHRFFDSLRSTYYEHVMKYDIVARFAIRYQDFLYYPILLFGRFNLYRLSWQYLLCGQAPAKGPAWWHWWVEMGGQLFFWSWFGYGILYLSIPDWYSRILFIMVSHMVTAPLHVQITLSHFAMSTADLGVHESFPQKMLRTTMDVDCPEWLDFFHGGLQFQAVHHLCPRLPRHNLRKAQRLVKDFCKETGIPYAIFTFVDGNKEVIGKLGDVAKQAQLLAECKKSIVASGFSDGHHH